MRFAGGLTATVCILLCACAENLAEPGPHLVTVQLKSGIFVAPDTVQSGFVRLRVEEDGAGHIPVLFQLASARDSVSRGAFLAALDTSYMTPEPGVARGGPEVGDTADVVIHLGPGRYLLVCMSRGADGHRHAGAGEWAIIEAVGPEAGSLPGDSPVTLNMVDYSFQTAEVWPSGSRVLKVMNAGREDHQLRLDRLGPGITLKQWFEAEGDPAISTPVTGVARIGPGQDVYLPMDLPPGNYVLYCLVPTAATGLPHVMVGMVKTIVVQ